MYIINTVNLPPPPLAILHDGISTRCPSRWHQYSENENIHQEMYIITIGNLPPPPLARGGGMGGGKK